MYSCVFWCEFIDLVGFFRLLLFDESDRGFSTKRYWAITLPQVTKRYRYTALAAVILGLSTLIGTLNP